MRINLPRGRHHVPLLQRTRQALEKAFSAQPTVIMLDLVMPGVNGLTMIKFFKSSEDFG